MPWGILYAAACVPLLSLSLRSFARYARRRAWSGPGAAWFLLGVLLLTVAIDAFRALLFALVHAPSAWISWLVVTIVGGAAVYLLIRTWKQLGEAAAGATSAPAVGAPPAT